MTDLLMTPDALLERRAQHRRGGGGGGGGDGAALAQRLAAHVDEVLAHPLYVPEAKALLSRWGAACHDDEAPLGFDPWSPDAQRCTKCGRGWQTEQSHRWWVYWYQLWLAERTLLLALHSGEGGHPGAEARALATLEAVAERYGSWPNADNVLGPSRPFFSTYLESIWVLHLAAAASVLGGLGRLPAGLDADLAAHLFRPSAALIADFDEGRSNRQVWNAAALFALGRVLGDAPLARDAAHGPSGLLATLDGLLDDGLWYEGENYHWFALRGLGWGAQMLETAGEVNLWRDERAGRKFRAAFRAPVLTALPDFTFPARRDSKFGVSLRQRRMAELWELAAARDPAEATRHASLLAHVYDPAVPVRDEPPGTITEVERAEPPGGVRRDGLGWKGWLWMAPELPAAPPDAWKPGSSHVEATGLAITRREGGATYVSVDYGEPGGGHGHPDRLNLTLVAGGVPWLLDFGTGSYVAPSLAWYRSTLAHNAPLVDALSQAPGRGVCAAWDDTGEWSWVCAQLQDGTAYDGVVLQRTVITGPGYLLDVMQLLSTTGERQLALPWHVLGALQLDAAGAVFTQGGHELRLRLAGRQPFHINVQRAPGPPAADGTAPEFEFPVIIAQGEAVTLAAVLDFGAGIDEVECDEDGYLVRFTAGHVHVHRPTDEGWEVERERGDPVVLGGLREVSEPAAPAATPLAGLMRVPGDRFALGGIPGAAAAPDVPSAGACRALAAAPALDGTLGGFDTGAPLVLDRADQFRRAEDPWEGADRFAAQAYLGHHGDTLFLAVEVTSADAQFRPGGAADPEWENENPDIHSDGIQVYVETPTGFYGWLLVPDPETPPRLRVSAVRGSDADAAMAHGAWAPAVAGYVVTCALEVPDLPAGDVGFDLAVNRRAPGRERRSGQLVWSGAQGARLYLAGDRPLPRALPRVSLDPA